MKKKFANISILVFFVVVPLYLFSCQNSFLADATKQYKVTFETNGGTEIASYRTGKIESSPKTTKSDYEFDGWYTNSSFDGNAITFPYELKTDTTLYAKWINEDNDVLTFNFMNCKTNSDFVNEILNKCENCYENGVLTLNLDKEKIIFKGNSSQTAIFSNLCIESSRAKQKLVFENFSFSSSKSLPLIKSSTDIDIEYKGTNKISSTSSDTLSLIKSLSLITFKGTDNNSSFEIQPNVVTSSKEGSIGVEANNVIIDGGNFVIQGSNGVDYSENDTSGTSGRNGSSGIRATEIKIQNKANVTITGGNGGRGSQGKQGATGKQGAQTDFPGVKAETGGTGYAGIIGGTGGHGGNAIDGNVSIDSSARAVLFKGGTGGKGGKGGTGGTGGRGGACPTLGGISGDGGKGGDGGTGGTGGNGGDAINGSIENSIGSNAVFHKGFHGLGGDPGERGIGGNPGENLGWGSGSGTGGWGDSGNPGTIGASGKDGVEHL